VQTVRSADGDGYALDREVADVRAVVEHVDGVVAGAAEDATGPSDHGDVGLVGHSFGALPAFEAARRSDVVSRLVLYEPPALLDRHRARTARRRRERVSLRVTVRYPAVSLLDANQ